MIELKSGSLTMLRNDEPIYEFGNVNGFIESEIEPYSLGQEVIKLNHEATFEAELESSSPLMTYTTDLAGRPFYIEYKTPIMIQARWHKKPRINKKWMKRYGMKKDYISVKCDVESVTPNINYDDEYLHEHAEYGMVLTNMQYKFRPDQLRKNLKMEMYYGQYDN